jgi:hypothetical protein
MGHGHRLLMAGKKVKWNCLIARRRTIAPILKFTIGLLWQCIAGTV